MKFVQNIATLILVKPFTVYNKRVYEQSVSMKLENGQTVSFFDNTCSFSKKDVGRKVRFLASILKGKIEENVDKLKEITPEGEIHARIKGKVIRLEPDYGPQGFQGQRLIGTIDAGAAAFSFTQPLDTKIKKGDWIETEGMVDAVPTD